MSSSPRTSQGHPILLRRLRSEMYVVEEVAVRLPHQEREEPVAGADGGRIEGEETQEAHGSLLEVSRQPDVLL